MKNLKPVLFALVLMTVGFSACSGKSDKSEFSSEGGLVPEAYLPADMGIVMSYSSLDDEQFASVQAVERDLGDKGKVSQTASETLDAQFGLVGLEFERDLKPAFGDQFRMVYAVRPNEENGDAFTVVTLKDPDQMEKVLETLKDAEQLSYKKLSDVDAYTNADASIYLTVYNDLLFMTNSPENLVGMIDQKEDDSLWESEKYQDAIADFGGEYVFYGILYPSLYVGDVSLPGGFSISDIPSVIDQQVFVVRAADQGFSFDAWVNANKDDAKDNGVSFDIVPKSEPYLFQSVPSDGLMGYFESYGLKQTFEQADTLGDDTSTLESLREMTRSYFGMDFDEDILSFLDKGYAIALHQNEDAAIPGISLFVDVSSNTESAKEFVNKLDGQLSGLMLVLQNALPGAVIKDTMDWNGTTFSRIQIDLSSWPQTSGAPLPSALTASPIQIVYGVDGDRLVLSTATDLNFDGKTVAESDLYQKLDQKLDGVKEGLILLDAQKIAAFTGTLRSLREQLNLQVSDQALELEDLLAGFSGAMAKSETEAYKSHFGGFLMLAD